ncbi:zinc finger protein 865-like, partial [Scleropages formosus]
QPPSSSSSQSSRKSSKMGVSSGSGGGSGGHGTGYPQFLRSFHPAEAALAQEQLHPGMGRFEHFPGAAGGSGGGGGIGGIVTTAPPPPPPLHPGLSVPQASPGPSSSSPSPSSSTSTSNNPPSSSSTVTSLGHQIVGAQSDARSLHQQFSCMLAANQYFLSGVPANASLEQFLVQQGTHNHLGLGLSQAGIPVLSTNQLASLMQQESGLPLPLPLLSLSKEEGKGDSGGGGSAGGGRRKKAMAGYLPQRKSESNNNNSNSSNSQSSGDPNSSNSSGRHGHDATSGLVVGTGGLNIPNVSGEPSILSSSSSSSSSAVSSSSSSAPSSTSASVLVTNGSQLSKSETAGAMAPAATQPEPEPLYHCGECGKTFTHLSSLRRHLRSHGLVSGSGSSTNTRNNPTSNPNHNHHNPDPSLPHSTQELTSQSNAHQQQTQQQASLNPQQQQSNPAPTSSSSCPSPEKTHRCPECGKGFKKRGHLLQHGVIHSGARPFACTICQRAFNRRESLTRHEKIHEEKPYRCPACGRCFRESTSLLNHAASGTCGKPGRGSRSRPSTSGVSNSMIGRDGHYGRKNNKTNALAAGGMESGESGVVDYAGGQLSGGVIYGKTEEEEDEEEEDGVVGSMMGGDVEDEKTGLSCEGLFQQGRGGEKTEQKYAVEYSRNRYQTSYRSDDFRADFKQHRSQINPSPCYPGELSCGSGMAGPALRKAPLAPTLHPHPQNQTQQQQHQQQQPHLPLSSLLDDSEDDVTSSVNSAISAIAAAAAASCMPGELSSATRGEERRDIIGGLLGGLGLGPLGVSPGGPSSTSGMDKAYRGGVGNQDGMGVTMTTSTNQNQQQHHQQGPTVKPKRPRKPRSKKEPNSGNGTPGEGSKRRQRGGASGDSSERLHGKLHQKGEYEEVPTTAGGSNINSSNSTAAPGGGISQERDQGNSDAYYSYPPDMKPQGANTQPPPRLYTCAICWKSFRHHFHLTAHHEAVHEGGDRLFCCEVCGKAFAYANSLTRHRLSQHGLTRTGHQTNQPGGSGVSGGSGNTSGSVSESEAATNTLLQLVPPTATHGGQQAHTSLSHSQQPPQQPPSGFSPLFYLPELGPPHPTASSAPTYSHPLPPNSTLTPLSNPQQPAGIKGEPMYQTGPTHTLNNAPSIHPLLLLPPSQQQHHHSQQHPVEMQPPDQQNLQSQGDLKKRKKKKKRKDALDGRGATGGEPSSLAEGVREQRNGNKYVSAAEKQKCKRRKLQKRKRGGTHQQQLKRKKRIAHVLKLRRADGASIKRLSSLDIPQKHFPCPFCPRISFPRQAALLVHRAVRHSPRTTCPQPRRECPACGKRSRKFLTALSHRGSHLARGSFSCPRCLSRFWNGILLERHTVFCRGSLEGEGTAGICSGTLKLKSIQRTVKKKEGQSETVLMEYRH